MASLLVKAGDRVRAGQVLATIDDRETQTGVQRSQAQVAQAEADLRNAKTNFERTAELRAKGFVSQAALDAAETQYKAAQAGRDQAVAGAKLSALAQGFTRVTAPYDGWVLQTLVDPGDLAVPGKPLLTVYAPMPLRAVVQVPASQDALARSASRVEVQLPAPAGSAAPTQWVTPPRRRPCPQRIRSRRPSNGGSTCPMRPQRAPCRASRCGCASWARRCSGWWCRLRPCCAAAN
ncbi:MAG: efflux RND transporter periplasmic adaptor subunit [Burkholderiaceae bacterium]|nr:MAG: efflux RND transporter periplasmic adaptor subunit [Burkholderiaceae bacterium]